MGVGRRTVQDWESGVAYPNARRLRSLVAALLESGALTDGREAEEAQELWTTALREAPRMGAPFDAVWFTSLLDARGAAALDAPRTRHAPSTARSVEPGEDWSEAPETVDFIGRTEQLALLRTWVLEERCRLVAVLGMGGIGKTSLVAKLAEEVAPVFERVYWRSLRDALPLGDWLAGAIGFLSDHQLVPPSVEAERLTLLLGVLRERRCLLVLDNFETVFEPGQETGRYRAGLAGYGRLLQEVREARHQSCLLLTSREAPLELAALDSESVRTFRIGGLGPDEVQVLLARKHLTGTCAQWAELTTRFGGNGLALKVVGERIRELFGGDLGTFLEEGDEGSVFGGIRRLIEQQVERSPAPEQQVLRILAVAREPVPLAALLAALDPRHRRGLVLEAVEGLRRRSLVELTEAPGARAVTLQSVVLEYMTERLVETVADEIARGQPAVLVEQPLIQAQAKEYVRHAQERLIGEPILHQLSTQHGEEQTQRRLRGLLDCWRGRSPGEQGYGPGNVVNLLRLLRGELRGLDLSRLTLRQAYLAEVEAQDASLADAHLVETMLAGAFDFPTSVALSADGATMATGTSTGEVWLWRVADRTPLWTAPGHVGGVWDVALSADGRLLASGGGDGTLQLRDVETGRLLATLLGHTGAVRGVALSADGELVASGSFDGTIRLWEARTGRPVATLPGHTGAVWGVALSGDGELLASGSFDRTIKLWETSTARLLSTLDAHPGGVYGVRLSADGQRLVSGGADGTVQLREGTTGRLLATLRGHTGEVWDIALSADGRTLASAGGDGTVRVWDGAHGRPLATLHGHTGTVRRVALSSDARRVASSGADGSVRLWDASTGQPLLTLRGQISTVWGVALSAAGRRLASGGADGTIRLWDTASELPPSTLRGHVGPVRGVALSADGELLASGGADGSVRLWHATAGHPLATLPAHAGEVFGVALSADGRLVASAGVDGTLRLWDAGTQRQLATLRGHTGGVRRVALSADGGLLASGGGDGTVRLWDAGTGRVRATLRGHTSAVWGVALSGDGGLVASGGADGTVRLWDTGTGRPLAVLRGHMGEVWGVVLSADGRLVASSGTDSTVRLWETGTGRPLAVLRGHTGVISGVALAADGNLLGSGGLDGTVRLWDVRTGTGLRAMQPERRYERMDITGLRGVTDAQRVALLALGAVERLGPTGDPAAPLP